MFGSLRTMALEGRPVTLRTHVCLDFRGQQPKEVDGGGHSASEGGHFRQISNVSVINSFCFYDKFRLFYTCFQRENLFISIFVQYLDISIFGWPKKTSNSSFSPKPSSIIPR